MRTRLLLRFVGPAIALGSLLASGCGGDSATGSTSTGTSTASGGGSPGDTCGAGVKVDTTGCTTVVATSADDTTKLQTALIDVKSSSTVCLCPGTFKINKQLSLTVPSVTLKGAGLSMEDTIIDFAGDLKGGNDTMLVTADSFTIENLWVKNTPGNGVVVRQADKPIFRKLKVTWDAGSLPSNGAYSIYPAECTNVLVEDCEVAGAADAAIYVGQSTGAIIRRNKAHGSVLGIELENVTNGEAYDNEIYDNTGGLAVFLLANLDKKDAKSNLLHDNNVHDNNRKNFGDKSTFVSSVPQGAGVLVVGADDTEIRNNTIKNNQSGGIVVVSYTLMSQLVPGAMKDPKIDPDPDRTYIHDNVFANNGTDPQTPLDLIGVKPLEDVVWDGIGKVADPSKNDAKFCLGTKSPFPKFRMFAGAHLADPDMGKPLQTTDTKPYECDLTPITGSAP
ncbi:MAG: parallel beta-helix domain-containing protein [Byssovorax sp.]